MIANVFAIIDAAFTLGSKDVLESRRIPGVAPCVGGPRTQSFIKATWRRCLRTPSPLRKGFEGSQSSLGGASRALKIVWWDGYWAPTLPKVIKGSRALVRNIWQASTPRLHINPRRTATRMMLPMFQTIFWVLHTHSSTSGEQRVMDLGSLRRLMQASVLLQIYGHYFELSLANRIAIELIWLAPEWNKRSRRIMQAASVIWKGENVIGLLSSRQM